MSELAPLIARYGYGIVVVIVFVESIGLPSPAALSLVTAGAAVAGHLLRAPILLPLALGSMLTGDTLLFFAGKRSGWRLLGFLCKVSANPETCILRSAQSFYKRGKITLVLAKFIPGINTMGPPLAGSMRMGYTQFLRFDLMGALLYVLAYFSLGFLGRDFFKVIGNTFRIAGHALEEVVVVAVIVYVVYQVWLMRKNRVYSVVPHVVVEELIKKLASEEAARVLVADVRSHGYYDPEAVRIKGSFRIEPNNLEEEITRLSKEKDVYLYCT